MQKRLVLFCRDAMVDGGQLHAKCGSCAWLREERVNDLWIEPMTCEPGVTIILRGRDVRDVRTPHFSRKIWEKLGDVREKSNKIVRSGCPNRVKIYFRKSKLQENIHS